MQDSNSLVPAQRGGISIFDYSDEHRLRIVEVNGEHWFVAADVCEALGIADPKSSVRTLDDDEKGVHSVPTPGGNQQASIINEPGLYSLILRSRRPEAKAFKRWVTHEVLPSIRKTGSYGAVPAIPQTYAEALRAHADAVEAREIETAARKVAEDRLAIAAPKASSYDRVIETEGMFSMTGIADMCNTSVNQFTGWLADLGVFRKGEYELFPGRRLPRKSYQDQGLFEVRIERNDKGFNYPVAYATPTGLDFTLKALRENGYID